MLHVIVSRHRQSGYNKIQEAINRILHITSCIDDICVFPYDHAIAGIMHDEWGIDIFQSLMWHPRGFSPEVALMLAEHFRSYPTLLLRLSSMTSNLVRDNILDINPETRAIPTEQYRDILAQKPFVL